MFKDGPINNALVVVGDSQTCTFKQGMLVCEEETLGKYRPVVPTAYTDNVDKIEAQG